MKFSYYPGCTLHSTGAEYDQSVRAVCHTLGIELVEIPGWGCCGATSAHSVNELLAYALPAHTITNATEEAIAAPCAACYNRLRYTDVNLRENASLRAEVEKALDRPYRAGVAVRHLLDIIANDVPGEEIQAKLQGTLGGLKVVCYYGCLLTRPKKVAAFDDMEEPRSMDRLMQLCGAEVLDWPHRVVCCGAAFSLSRTDIVRHMTGKLLTSALRAGAEAVVVACPMCQSNLDLRQPAILKERGVRERVPAVYFTQLLGLALGHSAKALGFRKIMVDTSSLLARVEAGREAPAEAEG
ncbi:MAG: CoB--CoM heterodisulfide reductase iron-sulfur subunit B family protein [Candidatus Coatesbacteria bacterium]|nr:MAG: CoB--CoM heterodisulfide reductase iron-sulfur subunit B family protein [Candidatus Coatesbacteria bacterium]